MSKIKLIEIVKNEKMAIQVQSYEQVIILISALSKFDLEWSLAGRKYWRDIWNHVSSGYDKTFCIYPFKTRSYSNVYYCNQHGYVIIPFEDVEFDAEPKVKTLEELGWTLKNHYGKRVEYSKTTSDSWYYVLAIGLINDSWGYYGYGVNVYEETNSLFFDIELSQACLNKIKELESK